MLSWCMTEHYLSIMDISQPALGVIGDFAAIKIAGAKADSFLQGQFTCDIRTLKPDQATPGACCDHKGRMLANGWLARWQENFMLFLPKNMLNLTIEHLQKFAVFSKVNLTEESGWAALNYAGGSLPALPAGELIHSQLSYRPFPLSTASMASCLYPALGRADARNEGGGAKFSPPCDPPSRKESSLQRDAHDYFLHWIMGPEESVWLMQKKLMENAVPMKPSILQLFLIAAQTVFIQPATRALFTPQMIGLEKLGGVSFSKGCYVGQEIIARTQHLGQLKRHLQTLRLDTGEAPQVGDPLFNDKNEEMGHIAAVAADPQGGYRLLAVVQDRALPAPLFAGKSLASRISP